MTVRVEALSASITRMNDRDMGGLSGFTGMYPIKEPIKLFDHIQFTVVVRQLDLGD